MRVTGVKSRIKIETFYFLIEEKKDVENWNNCDNLLADSLFFILILN